MNAQELRIGNWINYDGENIELTRNRFKLLVFTLGCDFTEPILITEEWLFKLGFINTQIGLFEINVLSRGKINIHINKKRLLVEIGTTGSYLFGETKIKSIHQLQNLYFALTGEELTLQEGVNP